MPRSIDQTEHEAAIAAAKVADAATTASKVVADAADEASRIAMKATITAAEASVNHEREMVKVLVEALRQVFGENQDSGRFIDVSRIPLICQNINNMHQRIEKIDGNITWIVRLIIGAVVLALLGLVLTRAV